MKTVEIFKTDVGNYKSADWIILLLEMAFPHYKSNFDLNDQDNILRIESGDDKIEIEKMVKATGHVCFNLQ